MGNPKRVFRRNENTEFQRTRRDSAIRIRDQRRACGLCLPLSEQRAHAPGILMLKEIMKWCYDRGVRDFDLCRGEEPYKQQMGAVNQPVCRVMAKL